MNQHILRHGIGVLLLLLLLGHAARLYQIPVLGNLDQIAYDTKLKLTMPRDVDKRVVILDIDERSLAEIGRWPWGRERLATLLDTLFDHYGVSLLGVVHLPANGRPNTSHIRLRCLVRHDGVALVAVDG